MPADLEPEVGRTSRPPSGEQVMLASGAASAVVTGVGGGIRAFEVGGEPVLFGYPVSEMCSGGRGQVLAPWPNRLADGRYRFGAVEASAALDEPERANAIHGLVRWLDWRPVARDEASVTMAAELAPQPGYPWRLALEVGYVLAAGPRASEASLTVTASARNLSSSPAPFGIGFHPYVNAGEHGVDGCRLELPASHRLETDSRGLPMGTVAVAGTEFDYGRERVVGVARLDECFFGLTADAEGTWRVRVDRGDGRFVTVSGGPELPYVMCYTGDSLPDGERRRGIAIEPMSCPPNALATGTDLVVLEPGGGRPFSAAWRIATGR